ncbi:Kunitz/Bovine pancreatic trypsin inhibitor domain protein, partial [Ancylostoma caninum]
LCRWYWNNAKKDCLPFIFYGQGGNFNNFLTKEHCSNFCSLCVRSVIHFCNHPGRLPYAPYPRSVLPLTPVKMADAVPAQRASATSRCPKVFLVWQLHCLDSGSMPAQAPASASFIMAVKEIQTASSLLRPASEPVKALKVVVQQEVGLLV